MGKFFLCHHYDIGWKEETVNPLLTISILEILALINNFLNGFHESFNVDATIQFFAFLPCDQELPQAGVWKRPQ